MQKNIQKFSNQKLHSNLVSLLKPVNVDANKT